MNDQDEITAYLARRLTEARRERDKYRTWFERLLPIAWRQAAGDPALEAELSGLREKHDRVVNARTRSNKERGQRNRDAILAMQRAGRSITETARDLDLSVGYVARVRGDSRESGLT